MKLECRYCGAYITLEPNQSIMDAMLSHLLHRKRYDDAEQDPHRDIIEHTLRPLCHAWLYGKVE